MAKPTNSTAQVDLHPLLHNMHVDAKMFGAIGDGVATEATALQATIDGAGTDGGTVYVPAGTYLVNSTLTMRRGQVIRGAGPNATKLVHNAGANPMFTMSGASLTPAKTQVRDLTILGGTGTGNGVELNGTSGNIISDVQFVNVDFSGLDGTYVVKMTWALETMFDRCNIRGCLGTGLSFQETSNASVVRDCTLSNGGTGSTAIEVLGSATTSLNGVTIDGCVIEAWRGSYGVRVDGNAGTASHVRVLNSHFEDIDGIGLYAGAAVSGFAADIVVDNCHFAGDAGMTSALTLKALNAVVSSCSFSADGVTLETAGGGNNTYYTLVGNRFVAGATLTDSTTANQDHVVLIANRGLAAPVGSKFGPSVEILRDRGIQFTESGDPSAPATNNVVIYSRDSGGKTQLVARFPTGAVQQLAIEP